MDRFIDLHIHTILSDGILTPQEIINNAYSEGIRHIALTDHNKIHTNLDELRLLHEDMEIISASEISSEWYTPSGEKKEIHVVGLYLDQTDSFKAFMDRNNDDGIDRLEKMLAALKECGVTFGGCLTYQDFRSRYFPDRSFIGRMQLSKIAVQEGWAASVDEFMDEYIGDYGKRRAYVPSTHNFAPLAEVIRTVHEASGVAVLAHPKSYKLSDEDVAILIDQFKEAGGDAMECYYSKYPETVSAELEQTAEQKGLLVSCASDYHGNRVVANYLGHYPEKYIHPLRERHQYYKAHRGV